jgi:hypothetical protein
MSGWRSATGTTGLGLVTELHTVQVERRENMPTVQLGNGRQLSYPPRDAGPGPLSG